MLNADWTEIGIGFATQQGSSGFLPQYGTEVFGRYNPGPSLTGVAFHDLNENRFYEAGEGVGGVTVTVTGATGVTFVTTTAPAGGWALPVPSGDYVVSASGGGLSGTSSAPVRVGSQNVAVDFISGSSAASVSFIPHVNSAPVLITDEDRFFAPVIAGTQDPRGQTVGNLLGTDFTDVDPLSPSGIAVTATTVASGGSWQFSIDGGGTWQSLGTPSTGAARLLRSTDMLRFIPGDSAPATASLSYRAWDQATGTAGGVADVSSAGGSTAFSTATATGTVHVVSSNMAPVLSSAGTNPFHSVAEDTAHPSGSPVRHLVGSGFSDSDPGTPVGIAVIDATGGTNGVWQYSLDSGATWSVLGAVSNGASLLLSGNNRLRFLPAADYNGTVTLTYRAWDASTGGAGDRVNLTAASDVDGSTGFSSEAVTASLNVTPFNDAPVFLAGASALRLRPVPANATQQQALGIGTRVGDLLGNVQQDVDALPLRGIAIIGTGGNGTFWWNTGSGGWSTIAAGPNFATLLRDTDFIYFHPSSGFSGTSSLTFRLWDQTSGNHGWNGANLSNPATSTGGSTAFGTDVLEARVFVGAAGTPPSATFGNPTRDENGRVVASIPLSLSRAVSGLDPGDLTLSRNGTPVPLLGARVEGSDASFTVAGLEDATTMPGTYILRLVAAGSGITDEAGNPLSGDASVTFVVDVNQTTAPSAPTNLSAMAGNAQASLTWTAPSSNGGASITDYIVQYSSNSGSSWTAFNRAPSTATSATVTGLTNGTSYVFRVAAVNSVGTSAFSSQTALVPVAEGVGTPITLAAVANQRLQSVGFGPVWQFPEGDVTLGGVRFSIPVGGENVWTGAAASGANPRVLNVPVNTFGVVQVHTLINTLWGERDTDARASITFHGDESAVHTVVLDGDVDLRDYLWNTHTNAINGTTTVNVFTAGIGQGIGPNNQVRLDMQTLKLPDVFASQTLTHISISDWGDREYQRLIVSGITIISADVPVAPTNVSATAGNAQASLTWTAPSSNGGASITDYIVQYSSNSGSSWTTFNRTPSTATSATVTGLTNGTSYVFRVAAVNSVGTGSYSLPSTAIVLNQAPTDIALSETTIAENAGANAVVGALSATDPDTSDTFTYTLVTGADSTDNAVFNISGNQLRVTASLDFESKSSYSVRVRSTDQAGLFTEKAFTISVIDVNEAPTAVSLTPATRTLPDNTSTAERFKLADISVIDDALGTNSLALVGDDADTFELIGTELYLKAGVRLDGLSKPAHVVIVEARDATLPGIPQSAQFNLSVVASGVEVADGQVVADTTVRTGDYRMIKRGLGTLILDLANTHAGGTIVEAGEVIVRNPLSLGSGSLVVQAGAKLRLDIGTGRVSLPALTLAGTATLDLGTGSLMISAGGFDLAGLRESIVSGRNNGTWAGRGITSSGIQPGTSREVGYRVLQDGSLLVGYSAVGDTNMDGSVNIQDLIEISTSGKYGSGSADATWWQGDFNYDGVVNITDLINLSTSGLYGAGSYMPATAAGAVSPQPSGSSFGSLLAGLTAAPTGYTAQADLAPAATPSAIESADQMTTTPSSPRQASGRKVVGRLAWAAIANQGVLESPQDAKASRWRLVAR